MENSNKKVGIMTWHTYNNYGSVLQAYATQKIIANNTNFTPELIQYMPKQKKVSLLKRLKIKNILFKIFNSGSKLKENIYVHGEKFNDFRNKYFKYSTNCKDATELFLLNNEYEKFVCGSDQIWAPTVFDENYFLSFVDNNSKKISYAPSIGMNSIENKEIRENMASLIKTFDSLSIREESGKEIIKSICGKNASVVLDPTLLLSKEEWKKNFQLDKTNIEKDSYILCYFLGENNNYYKIVEKIAKKYNKKIVLIPGKYKDYANKKYDIVDASPDEFLRLIYNSYLVITDSFHGTIFSINFNVPFVSLRRFKDNNKSQNSRIYNILKKVNLEDRLYNNNLDYFLEKTRVDFNKSNIILQKERKESLKYLMDSLNKPNLEENRFRITNLCVGCGMCASVCPKNCIKIEKNSEGFFYYKIDFEKCIRCGNCKKVCGQLQKNIKSIKDSKLYSVYSNNETVLKNSSSGGIAYELSKLFLDESKSVIACIYDNKKNIAKHVVISNSSELSMASGSKYLQSYSKDAFAQLTQLNEGIVIGTPCQIGSVDKYLKQKNKRDGFILVDLICHGVPTNLLWEKFIKKYKNIESAEFRNKIHGWKKMTMCINKKYYIKKSKNEFYDFFYLGNVYGKHCYECKYRTYSCADLKIGDYWGEKFKSNDTGVSMVIVNTQEGKNILNKLIEENIVSAKLESINDYYNVQQIYNFTIPRERAKIINELKNDKLSLKNISDKYCRKSKNEERFMKFALSIYSKMKGRRNG